MYARICARPYPYACNAYSHTRGRELARRAAHMGTGARSLKYARVRRRVHIFTRARVRVRPH